MQFTCLCTRTRRRRKPKRNDRRQHQRRHDDDDTTSATSLNQSNDQVVFYCIALELHRDTHHTALHRHEMIFFILLYIFAIYLLPRTPFFSTNAASQSILNSSCMSTTTHLCIQFVRVYSERERERERERVECRLREVYTTPRIYFTEASASINSSTSSYGIWYNSELGSRVCCKTISSTCFLNAAGRLACVCCDHGLVNSTSSLDHRSSCSLSRRSCGSALLKMYRSTSWRFSTSD
jgi:hypothetical protein